MRSYSPSPCVFGAEGYWDAELDLLHLSGVSAALLVFSWLALGSPAGVLPVERPAVRLHTPTSKWKRFRSAELTLGQRPSPSGAVEVALGPLLDRNRALVALKLGRDCPLWRLGLGFDAGFRERFVLMTCGERTVARRLAEGERLRKGIVLEPEPGARYRLAFKLRVPRPGERSLLALEPLAGAPGVPVAVEARELFERLSAAAALVRVGRRELGLFYVSDLDPATGRPAGTRTILLVERKGARSVAWPLPEASLPEDLPVRARLGGEELALVRTSGGVLRLYPPESVRSSSPEAASR